MNIQNNFPIIKYANLKIKLKIYQQIQNHTNYTVFFCNKYILVENLTFLFLLKFISILNYNHKLYPFYIGLRS